MEEELVKMSLYLRRDQKIMLHELALERMREGHPKIDVSALLRGMVDMCTPQPEPDPPKKISKKKR